MPEPTEVPFHEDCQRCDAAGFMDGCFRGQSIEAEDPGAPTARVEVTLVHFASPDMVEVVYRGSVVCYDAMSGTGPETIVLTASAIEIAVIKAEYDGTLLLELCARREMRGLCTGRAAADDPAVISRLGKRRSCPTPVANG